jgi:hypothetical protein
MTNTTITEKDKLEIEAMALEIRDLAFIQGFIHKKIGDSESYETMIERCINQRMEKIREILKL